MMPLDYRPKDLKEREIEIIHLMADGATNQQIADKFYISLNTVRWYNKQIYSKFGVNSRIKVVNLAREWGLLDDPPSLSKIDNLPKQFHNLPVQTNLFIGRADDFTQVQKLLVTKRLLTLTGTAGIGKTRFAIQLAKRVLDNYEDGVCFVPLGALTDAKLVPKMVAAKLNLKENPKQPILETVSQHLAGQNLLLILDNFEHIMDAGEFVQTCLIDCPDITILITSREIFHWQSEQVYQLQPLSEPNLDSTLPDMLQANEAVQLFIDRARKLVPDEIFGFTDIRYIAEICHYLEGLPLAIELAAAQSDLFSPEAMLEQLTNRLKFLVSDTPDLPARQQSLRQALDWSFTLLAPAEQILFKRLSVFRGGFTLESVEKICLVDLDIFVVDGIALLLHKSLIDVIEDDNAEPRFLMLETMREYAYEKLIILDEFEDLQADCANYYRDIFAPAFRERDTKRQKYWINRAKVEIDNLRSSLEFFYKTQQAESGIRILSGLYWFFRRQGYIQEMIGWYTKFFSLNVPITINIEAQALIYCGNLIQDAGDHAQSLEMYKTALALAEKTENYTVLGLASGHLALHNDVVLPDGRDAFDLAHQARNYFKESNDIARLSWAENLLGELYAWREDYFNATEHYQLSLEIAEELKNPNRIATAHVNLGRIAVLQNDFKVAIDTLLDALHHNEDAKNVHNINGVLLYTALLLTKLEFYIEACQLLGLAGHIRAEYGFSTYIGDASLIDNTLAMLQNNLDADMFNLHWQKGFQVAITEAGDYCRAMLNTIHSQLPD